MKSALIVIALFVSVAITQAGDYKLDDFTGVYILSKEDKNMIGDHRHYIPCAEKVIVSAYTSFARVDIKEFNSNEELPLREVTLKMGNHQHSKKYFSSGKFTTNTVSYHLFKQTWLHPKGTQVNGIYLALDGHNDPSFDLYLEKSGKVSITSACIYKRASANP